MLLVKTKLITVEVLISKALIDSYINHDEFVAMNNGQENIIIWKNKSKILKLLWNILYQIKKKKKWKPFVSVLKKVLRTKILLFEELNQNRLVIVSNMLIVVRKNQSKFIKNQEMSRLLRKLGIRTPSSNILSIGDILL